MYFIIIIIIIIFYQKFKKKSDRERVNNEIENYITSHVIVQLCEDNVLKSENILKKSLLQINDCSNLVIRRNFKNTKFRI